MDDFALTPAERALFAALNRRGVRFIIIGMGAAVLQGAPVATQDLDVWFSQVEDEAIRRAAADAGGFWISGFGMQPPAFGGDDLARIDVVPTAHGLETFAIEHACSIEREIEGAKFRVLPLDRVIVSKRATGRLKDTAQLPVLEATLLARDEADQDSSIVPLTERQGLRDVVAGDGGGGVEVRDGAGDAEDAFVGAGAQLEASAAPARRSRASAVGAPSSRRRRPLRALL